MTLDFIDGSIDLGLLSKSVACVLSGRGRGDQSLSVRGELEAWAGFEPAHNGFADRSLNHLGTTPLHG